MARPDTKLDFNTDWQYAPAPEATDHIRIDQQYELFIGGEFVAPRERQYFDTINPAREKTLARVARADSADVDRAVAAARQAYERSWSKLKPAERGKYLFRIARMLQERAREFAAIESLDGGNPCLVIELVVDGDGSSLNRFLRSIEEMSWVTRVMSLSIEPGSSVRRINIQVAVMLERSS